MFYSDVIHLLMNYPLSKACAILISLKIKQILLRFSSNDCLKSQTY